MGNAGWTGATVGGGQGLLTAVRTKPELGIDTARLRINRVLNLSGRTGRSAGNALGCLGLFYASSESGLDYLNDGRLPDLFTSLGAGRLPLLLPSPESVAGRVGLFTPKIPCLPGQVSAVQSRSACT